MSNNLRPMDSSRRDCLADEDFSLYISGQGNPRKSNSITAHLAKCSDCRKHLASLLEILNPESQQTPAELAEPSDADLDRTIGIIQAVSKRERGHNNHPLRSFRWLAAAAAAIAFVALGFWSFKYVYERNKSEIFYSQARLILEQNYTGTSPENLRLVLPFGAGSIKRSSLPSETLHSAENLLFQALAVREDMVEAHLGLAYIYLDESKAARARDEFQKVLNLKNGNIRALVGRGVAQYEEAVQGKDPTQRNALLSGALGDFDAALKLDPDLLEARYNRIWTLVESGRHKEADQEIERYLSRDAGSMWAEQLRGLKIRIRATQSSAVEKDVRRFADKHNEISLRELAREAPYKMPAAILSVMKQSLEMGQSSVAAEGHRSEDLRWAAQILEAEYSVSTGDHSFKAFLAFCDGLSPPQRARKIALDRKFQTLDQLYRDGHFDDVLLESASLENGYTNLRDFWQLTDLHHLRGNSFYLGRADFDAAEAEYRKMLESADRLDALDFEAKAIGSLATIHIIQRKFDESFDEAGGLKKLAQEHNLPLWRIHACVMLGYQLRKTGQFEQSLREFAAALRMSYRFLDGVKVLESLENLGIVMDLLGHIQEARNFYRQALQQQDDFLKSGMIRPMPEVTVRRLNLLFRLGKLALHSGDFASAEKYFRESSNFTASGMHELEGRNRLGLAETYLKMNRIRDAESMVDSAIVESVSRHYPEIEWQARTIKGRLLRQSGRYQEAFASFEKAIAIIERMQKSITSEESRESFLMDRYDPFRLMVSLLYQSAGGNETTLEFVERAKSATLKERLNQQGLTGTAPGDAAVQDSDSAYPSVEYFFTQDALLIFLSGRGHTEAVSQSIRVEEMSRQVQDYLQSIQNNDSKSFTRISRLLYEELILPIEKHAFAETDKTLVILPDGPLHLLPFAGLQDKKGRFLIEKTPLAFAPSRSVFRYCVNSSRAEGAGSGGTVLIDGSANLPSARNELAHLSRLYGGNVRTLTSKDLPVFREALAGSRIIHFSGHSINIQSRPVLLLQTSPDKVYLDCRTINSWKMPDAYLVNLAGCSTGIGPLSTGEAPLGLIPAFLNAGAPAVIASLIPVDDASTGRLNCLFYDLLQQGVEKARALQRAQLALLHSSESGPDFNPQAWTPYILIGNPK